MKYFSIIICMVMISTPIFSQSFATSNSCQININNTAFLNHDRENVIDATFRVRGNDDCSFLCTGTLVNRNTSDGDLGFYFITANHCFSGCNLDGDFTFMFNYQSPTENTFDTPLCNRGNVNIQAINQSQERYEYRHRSRVRLVQDFFWGDFAMFEILTPLPAHFQYSYAGWNTSRFFNGADFNNIVNSIDLTVPTRFVTIHQPLGDIKKVSGYNYVNWMENPIATGCYTITTIIDAVFGWLWGNSVSTQVICNYIDNPWMEMGLTVYGAGDHGSSGASMFNSYNQTIGVCSLISNWCTFPSVPVTYGKLHANYPKQSIRDAFNPSHDIATDWYGMPPRRINCYPNLNLNGPYFAANHHQMENLGGSVNNLVELKANNNITTGSNLRIFGSYQYPNSSQTLVGAEYSFSAGNGITLNPGFTVDAGAKFTAKIQSCNAQRESTPQSIALAKIKAIKLPNEKFFDSSLYASKPTNTNISMEKMVTVFPNPASDMIEISALKGFDLSNLRFK